MPASQPVPAPRVGCGTRTRQRGFRLVTDALAAAIVSLSLLASTVALGSPETSAAVIPEPLAFQGRIEAVHRAEVSTRIDGRVKGLLVEGGEQVDEGQPLIELASAGLARPVTAAQAEADRSAARLALAQQEAARLRERTGRNAASEVERQDREASLAIAHAEVAMAKAALEQARLRLENATIRAPIAGIVSRPRIAPGSFVEAKEGDPLATIVRLDPVFVVYQVPYAVRLENRAIPGGVVAGVVRAHQFAARPPGRPTLSPRGQTRLCQRCRRSSDRYHQHLGTSTEPRRAAAAGNAGTGLVQHRRRHE